MLYNYRMSEFLEPTEMHRLQDSERQLAIGVMGLARAIAYEAIDNCTLDPGCFMRMANIADTIVVAKGFPRTTTKYTYDPARLLVGVALRDSANKRRRVVDLAYARPCNVEQAVLVQGTRLVAEGDELFAGSAIDLRISEDGSLPPDSLTLELIHEAAHPKPPTPVREPLSFRDWNRLLGRPLEYHDTLV